MVAGFVEVAENEDVRDCESLQPSELFSPTVQNGTDSARSVARMEGQSSVCFRAADDPWSDGKKKATVRISFTTLLDVCSRFTYV